MRRLAASRMHCLSHTPPAQPYTRFSYMQALEHSGASAYSHPIPGNLSSCAGSPGHQPRQSLLPMDNRDASKGPQAAVAMRIEFKVPQLRPGVLVCRLGRAAS